MRDYAKISPRFWTGKTGKALRGHQEAQIVSFYLMTAPGSHMIGMYPLELPTLGHHTGLTFEGSNKGLARLAALDFAYFDDVAELVWVPEMASFQIAERLKKGDKRIKGIENELENYRNTRFFNEFLDKYCKRFLLQTEREPVRPSEGPPKPHDKTLPSQEQEKEKEQDQDPNKASSAAPTGGDSGNPVFSKLTDDANLVFEEWRRVMGKTAAAKFSPERERKVLGRLKDGYTVERLFKAIRGCKASPHHQGQNDTGTVYDDLELICRDGKHVETFEGFVDRPPAPQNGAGRKVYVPLTGTSERFKNLDDGDPLGLNLQPKPKEPPRG